MDKLETGGSSRGVERCPICGEPHEVYREGSWDRDPVQCEACQKKSIEAVR